MPIMAHEIGNALCDALGLPKYTKSFVLRVEANQVVTVECEYYPALDHRFESALAEFELVRRPEQQAEPARAAVHFDDWYRERMEIRHRNFMLASSLSPARFR